MPTFTQQIYGALAARGAVVEHGRPVRAAGRDPLHGHPVRRIGRKPLLLACCVGFVVLPYPLFSYLRRRRLASYQLIAGPAAVRAPDRAVLRARAGGDRRDLPDPHALHLDDDRLRLAVAIFGGFAPYIAAWLISETGSPMAHYLLSDRRRDRVDDRDLEPARDRAREAEIARDSQVLIAFTGGASSSPAPRAASGAPSRSRSPSRGADGVGLPTSWSTRSGLRRLGAGRRGVIRPPGSTSPIRGSVAGPDRRHGRRHRRHSRLCRRRRARPSGRCRSRMWPSRIRGIVEANLTGAFLFAARSRPA